MLAMVEKAAQRRGWALPLAWARTEPCVDDVSPGGLQHHFDEHANSRDGIAEGHQGRGVPRVACCGCAGAWLVGPQSCPYLLDPRLHGAV